jgi:hypothetical protein
MIVAYWSDIDHLKRRRDEADKFVGKCSPAQNMR